MAPEKPLGTLFEARVWIYGNVWFLFVATEDKCSVQRGRILTFQVSSRYSKMKMSQDMHPCSDCGNVSAWVSVGIYDPHDVPLVPSLPADQTANNNLVPLQPATATLSTASSAPTVTNRKIQMAIVVGVPKRLKNNEKVSEGCNDAQLAGTSRLFERIGVKRSTLQIRCTETDLGAHQKEKVKLLL